MLNSLQIQAPKKRAFELELPRGMVGVGLFVSFSVLFLCLPSKHYTAVDGALRSLGNLRDPQLLFHGNNHLLYPFWVSLWVKFSENSGLHAANAFEFIRIVQAMNALLVASSIAILYSVIADFVESQIAVLCALVFGFSTAVVLHGTNAAEPVVGLFFAIVGVRVLILGLRRTQSILVLFAGICFALAMASYQAMASIVGVGALVCVWWSISTRAGVKPLRRTLFALLPVGCGGILAVTAIYGIAYSQQGISAIEMPRQFFSLTGAEVYSGFTVSKIANVPFGLIRNLFGGLPSDYFGIRSLIRHPQSVRWISVGLASMLVLIPIALLTTKAWRWETRNASRMLTWASLACGFLLIFPLVYWDPIYDKLWLLPIATAAAAVSAGFRPAALARRERKVLAILLIGLVAAEMAVNVPRAISSHMSPTPHLSQAADLSTLIGPHDWMMGDFDDVSGLWFAIFRQQTNALLLPASTRAKAKEWLDSAKAESGREGTRLFFVGVMDQDRNGWDAFLGHKVGIPFSLLDDFRAHSKVVRTYSYGKGAITVRQYSPDF